MNNFKIEHLILLPTNDERLIGTSREICSQQYQTYAEVRYCRAFNTEPITAITIFRDYTREIHGDLLSEQPDDSIQCILDLTIEDIFCHVGDYLDSWYLYGSCDENGRDELRIRGIKNTNSTADSGFFIDAGPVIHVSYDDCWLSAETKEETFYGLMQSCDTGMQRLCGIDSVGQYLIKNEFLPDRYYPEILEGTAVMLIGKTGYHYVKRLYYRPSGSKKTKVRADFGHPTGALRYHGVQFFDMLGERNQLNIKYKPEGDHFLFEKMQTAGMKFYALNIGMTELQLSSKQGEISVPPCELADISMLSEKS